MSKLDPEFSRYINTSCDDLKSSLHHVNDTEFLGRLLEACIKYPTKGKLVAARLRQLNKAVADAPAASLVTGDEAQERMMGQQIEEQYPKAIGASLEVMKFGAMLLHVVEVVLTVRTTPSRGPTAKGGGLKGWLEKYAPTVNYKTACRFLDVAESIRAQFALPPKTAKQISFCELATTPEDKLPEQFRGMQSKLFSFVKGTSQKSWLDKFKKPTRKGGNQTGDDEPQKLKPHERAEIIWAPIIRDLQNEGLHTKSWKHLSDETLATLKGLLIDLNEKLPAK